MTPQHDPCAQGIKNEQRIVALERDMGGIKDDIKDMKEGLLRRPSWAVTIIITLLSSTTFASLTFALTVLKESLLK